MSSIPMPDRSISSTPTLVLVIEDEPAVRIVAVETLEIKGFEVILLPPTTPLPFFGPGTIST
jgi:hypothetical protein